jgi:polyphosphate kinase
VYGVTGLKTHSKLTLIVRNEGGTLRRYAHIGTGNYNPNTARVYTDFGLLTAHKAITKDVADIFNRITGFAQPPRYRHLLVAPHHLRKGIIKRIKREERLAREGRPAHVILKCNALTDRQTIDALYAASNAGVRIDLIIRGICCLVPGVPGQSENIAVRSIVGRFLEHSRCYWFGNDGKPEVLIGSADLMERNLSRRVEVLTPVIDPVLAAWLREVYLQRYLDDDGRARVLAPDGTYTRIRPPRPTLDVHRAFLADKKRA